MSATNRARGHRALAALVLLAIWASAAAACGLPLAARPRPSPLVRWDRPPTVSPRARACPARREIRRAAGAPAPWPWPASSKAIPGAPALALQAPATVLVAPPARDTLPASRVVAPLQHPPNPVS